MKMWEIIKILILTILLYSNTSEYTKAKEGFGNTQQKKNEKFHEIKNKYIGNYIYEVKMPFEKINKMNNSEKIVKVRDSIYVYNYKNIYIHFSFVFNILNEKLKEKYTKRELIDEYNYYYIMTITDTIKKTMFITDRNVIHSYYHVLIETNNYLYFVIDRQGSETIWQEPFQDYISGIILFNKNNLTIPVSLDFPLESIVKIEEKNGNLYLITSKVIPQFKPLKELQKMIVVHSSVGKFVSTGQYFEYIYDTNLNLVARKEVPKPADDDDD